MAEIALGRVISGGREISRDTLMERAACAATGLGELGLGAGDAVGIVLRNDFAFFESSYAAQRLGAYSVPVNWHSKTREIAYVLDDCGAKAVVAHADLLPEIVPAMPSGAPLFVVPTPPEIAAAYGIADEPCRPPPDALEWDDLATSFPPVAGASAGGISSMIYTSGTTGNPKGVRRLDIGGDPAQLRTFLMDKVFGIAPDRVVRTVITGPLYHSAPNAYGFYAVRMGGLAVLQPRFDAAELLRLIEQYRITHLHMVPTMFVRLLRLPEEVKRKYDLSSLEWVIHGAAPCPPQVKRAMIEWWGPGHLRVLRRHRDGDRRVPHRRGSSEEARYRRATSSRRHGAYLRPRWPDPARGPGRRDLSLARRLFPISPTTAWTANAAKSGATAWSHSAMSAFSTRTAISSSAIARATW